jgi:2-C-methyl-D-erythritol 4-phosphate cytidylyltransferase
MQLLASMRSGRDPAGAYLRPVLDDGGYRKLRNVITGGVDRPGSTRRASEHLSLTDTDRASGDCNVLFHDAARPLVDQRIIADCVAALADARAIGVVVPTADTIVEVADGVMTSIPPRESLARCQTPQGFRLSVIRRANELAAADPLAATFTPTDDCGIVLRYLPDVQVAVVPGSERNLKITYPGDLRIAEILLAEVSAAGRWPLIMTIRPGGRRVSSHVGSAVAAALSGCCSVAASRLGHRTRSPGDESWSESRAPAQVHGGEHVRQPDQSRPQ